MHALLVAVVQEAENCGARRVLVAVGSRKHVRPFPPGFRHALRCPA